MPAKKIGKQEKTEFAEFQTSQLKSYSTAKDTPIIFGMKGSLHAVT
jgi:hypothetical protein